MTIHRSTIHHGRGDYLADKLNNADDEVYDAQYIRRFHSPLQKALALLRHGPGYLNIRNSCTSIEPYDVDTRLAKLRHRLHEVVCDFRSINTHEQAVQSIQLTGSSRIPNASGIVVGIRPCRALPTRQIFDSDVILGKCVLGSIIVYTGEHIVAALLRPAHPSAHYGEWYTIPPDAIDPLVELRPEERA